MSDPFTHQLSAYLDGELGGVAARRLEAHLESCAECATILADLRAIVAAAPHYAGRAPARDYWPGIRERLGSRDVLPIDLVAAMTGTERKQPRRRFAWPHLIAASVAMAAIGAASVWLALRDRVAPAPAPIAAAPAPASPDIRAANFADQEYESAVRDLERLLAAGRSRLDTATVRVVEESLTRIDAAIAEARAAIQRDPANAYLSRQIAGNMRRKLNLLRAATNAIAART